MSTEWTVGISTMIVGALLAEFLARLDSYLKVRQRSDLFGVWHSISHAGDQDEVRDKVKLSIRWGRLHLTNLGNKMGYEYEVHCRIRDGHVIVGDWKSTRPGANNRGQVLLTINPQGTGMYGVYSGMDSTGKRMLMGWVLGRDQESLAETARAFPHAVGIPRHVSSS